MNLEHLNIKQKEAVQSIHGASLILAGAGTGKTTVLTSRIAYMVEQNISPSNILAITFTNKAANEMKQRVCQLLPQFDRNSFFISTFHSFCLSVIKKFYKEIGLFDNFTIFDPSDQQKLVREVLSELYLEEYNTDIKLIISLISKAKNRLILPENYQNETYNAIPIDRIYKLYQTRLKIMNSVDFDDLIFYVYQLWVKSPQILVEYQENFKYILIDEFQDTNYAQIELIKLLVKKYNNIFVVGDDDQSIYAWRGAEISNILDFENNFDNTNVIKLEHNYRSTNRILNAANKIINKNIHRYKKNLYSENGDGELLNVYENETPRDEASQLVNIILQNLDKQKYSPKDIAIIYRMNNQSRYMEDQLIKQQVPYNIIGDQSFFERKEIRDTIAYIQLLLNPYNEIALSRIIATPTRGIGKTSLDKARTFAKNNNQTLLNSLTNDELLKTLTIKTRESCFNFSDLILYYNQELKNNQEKFSHLIHNYLDEIGFLSQLNKVFRDPKDEESRRNNILEFMKSIEEYENDIQEENKSLQKFIDKINLREENRKRQKEHLLETVTLGTIHALKGLEYPLVFIIGVEEGSFPSQRSLDEGNHEEERRLFYVAITRAKEKLIFSWSKEKNLYNKIVENIKSRFLSELPIEEIEFFNKEKAISLNTMSTEEKATHDKLMEEIYIKFPNLRP